MDDVADNILSSFGLNDDKKKDYDTVVERFERHFVKKRNVIFECAKFNQRKQEEGESVDDFVTALYCLSEHCQYGELRNEMIRDRIVVGLHDSSLSEKLQLKADLTLEKAITSTRQRELVKKQQKVVRAEDTLSTIAVLILCGKKDKPVISRPVSKQYHKMNPVTSRDICNRCGKCSHVGRQQCPAREAICRKCHKCGHFQVVCQTRTVKAVSAEDSDDNSLVRVIEQPESLITPSQHWI